MCFIADPFNSNSLESAGSPKPRGFVSDLLTVDIFGSSDNKQPKSNLIASDALSFANNLFVASSFDPFAPSGAVASAPAARAAGRPGVSDPFAAPSVDPFAPSGAVASAPAARAAGRPGVSDPFAAPSVDPFAPMNTQSSKLGSAQISGTGADIFLGLSSQSSDDLGVNGVRPVASAGLAVRQVQQVKPDPFAALGSFK